MHEIHYNEDQLELAAKFIWKNNPRCSEWPNYKCSSYLDVKQAIVDLIRKTAKRNIRNYHSDCDWVNWTGTGGFILLFTSPSPNHIDVEIYVDPSIGKITNRYMTEFHESED